jgi:hypothetical protein
VAHPHLGSVWGYPQKEKQISKNTPTQKRKTKQKTNPRLQNFQNSPIIIAIFHGSGCPGGRRFLRTIGFLNASSKVAHPHLGSVWGYPQKEMLILKKHPNT